MEDSPADMCPNTPTLPAGTGMPAGTGKREGPKEHSGQSAPVDAAAAPTTAAVLDFGLPAAKSTGGVGDPCAGTVAAQAKEQGAPADPLREPPPQNSPIDTLRRDSASSELAFAAKLLANTPAVATEAETAAAPIPAAAGIISGPAPVPALPVALAPDVPGEAPASASMPSAVSGSGSGVAGKPSAEAPSQAQDSLAPPAARGSGNSSSDNSSSDTSGDDADKAPVPGMDRTARPEAMQTESAAGTAPAPAGSHADRADPPANPAPPRETSAARPAEPEMPASAPGPVSHGVSLKLGEGPSSVDIRMAERGGEIRVTVHTPDHDIANSLRGELPDLVGKLRQSGFQVETWRPNAAGQADAGRRQGGDSSTPEQHGGGRQDGQSPQHRQKERNQSNWAGEWQSNLGPIQESNI